MPWLQNDEADKLHAGASNEPLKLPLAKVTLKVPATSPPLFEVTVIEPPLAGRATPGSFR